jgi:hypothetical protein
MLAANSGIHSTWSPRRTYSAMLGRLLHDRTADKMARAVSRIQGATAIIVPYDVESRIARVDPDALAARVARETGKVESKEEERKALRADEH